MGHVAKLLFCVALIALPVGFDDGLHTTYADDSPSDQPVDSSTGSTNRLQRPPRAAEFQPFQVDELREDLVVVQLDLAALAQSAQGSKPLAIKQLPVRPDLHLDLQLERFSVTGPDTRFVVGRNGQMDQPLDFDPARIVLLRGHVAGHPGSHVFLGLSEQRSTGTIDLGSGSARFMVSSVDDRGASLAAGEVSIFEARPPGDPLPGIPLCGTNTPGQGAGARRPAAGPGDIGGTATYVPLRQIELAVETDFEFFSLFGDLDSAAAYLVLLYGQVSDIYMRDVNTRVELVFARLWDNPDDLFNIVDPSPLPEFQAYWNANMTGVHRDIAQLLSGRRDYPFGGQAYLSALCGSSGYSVVGYAVGAFPDPSMPSPLHYDIAVTAHEIGHNAGTGHTHDAPNSLDTCDDPTTTPQRGPIMSYCGQTWSGGNANRDLYFHAVIAQNMDAHISSSSCVADDCNMNSIADELDIQQGTSTDANANGVPDECEDCNDNGTLDDEDISTGPSLDLNANAVPDECEPDCNSNQVPDDLDIAEGTSTDAYGNGVPDECEADCNSNEVSDFTEIQADMALDVDRNAVLDSCQDCDGDGVNDLAALGGAHGLWVASGLQDAPIREFYASTGVLTDQSGGLGSALVNQGQDLIVTPAGNLLVSSGGDNRVMKFDPGGAYLGDLVPAGAGGLAFPTGLLITPDGMLLVCSRDTDNVLTFDGSTGTPMGAFVSAGAGGLTAPFGLTRGPNGNLFVTSSTNEIIEFDGQNGSLVGTFVAAGDNGGLDQPRGLVFKPDGNLLVASFGTNQTLEYDGTTGAALGKWASVGTSNRLTQVSPWGIRVGPNGNVFIIRTGEEFGSDGGSGDHHDHDEDDIYDGDQDQLHLTNAQIYEFDARTGNFVRTHIGGNDHGLLFPTAFDFVPGWDLDCNLNLLQDDCDIASGFSTDDDGSGVPDECEVDCNGNGQLDRLDIIPFGASRDCNANLKPDECDVASGDSPDSNRNGIPDECDPDCNDNGVPDDLDLADQTSQDCNNDNVPDECQLEGFDCNGNGLPDDCDADCDMDGVPDACEELALFADSFETDQGWLAESLGADSGEWQRGVPVDDPGWDYDPPADADGSGQCYLTQNEPGNSDVDGGAVRLTSPVLDLSTAQQIELRYAYYLHLNQPTGDDTLVVEINSAGGAGAWTEIARHDTTGGLTWRTHTITQADLDDNNVGLTASMVLRFTATDGEAPSIVEAGLDAFMVTAPAADLNMDGTPDECQCLGDLSGDGAVDAVDLAALLGAWGPNPDHPADLNADDTVGAADLAILLGSWGDC